MTAQHVASGQIERAALVERLSTALESGDVLLTAGAGYGKTTALEQALDAFCPNAAWVRCTPDDADPGHLLVRLLDALHRAVPGAVDVLRERLLGSVGVVPPLDALRRLMAELDDLLVDRIVIALDDAEQLGDAPGALELVTELLTLPEDKVRVAVAGRRAPALRIAKLRASGGVTELGAGDLAFSAEECAELLRRRHAREPTADEVDAAMEATHGWPLGIALGYFGRAETVATDPASRTALLAFIEEEILDPLDPRLRAALIDSSLPRELNASLAEAFGLGADFTRTAERLGLSLHQIDAGGDWYRYHPLVRELLLERLESERAAELPALHARVATELGAAGRTDEAVEHWLQARRWEEAVAGIGRCAPALLGAAPQTVRGWLERLPASAREQPLMLLVEGRLEYGAGRHDAAAELIRPAVAAFRERGEAALEWMARLALMDVLHASGDFEEAVELARGVDSPETAELPIAPNVAVMAAMCLAHQGRFAEAGEMNRRALDHPKGRASAALAHALDGLFLDRPAGRLDSAARKARQALAQLERSDPFDRRPFVRALLHLVLEEQGYDDAALEESLKAQEEARQIGVEGYLVAMLQMHSAGIYARTGRLAEAQRELDRAAGSEAGAGWRQVGVGRATLAAARGDAAEASARSEQALAKAAGGPFLQLIHTTAFVVPILANVGQHGRAREVLEDTLAAWRPGFYKGRLLALRAWLRDGEGDPDALADLRAAWDDAGDQAPHLLRREWSRLKPLVWSGLEAGVLDPEEAVRAVAAAWPGGEALLPLTRHPLAAVRRAAIGPALASGRPEVEQRLSELIEDQDASVAAAARAGATRIRQAPPPLSFCLLGGFELRRGSWLVDAASWGRPMAARLVRFLLVNRGAAVSEDLIFETFWPGKPPSSARRSLHVAVSRARSVLEEPGGGKSRLEGGEQSYRLRLADRDIVDVDEFELAAEDGLAESGGARRRPLERADALWRGDPLPDDRYEDWCAAWRERLIERYGQVLMALADVYREAGDHPAEIEAARKCLELDPANESVHRKLMVAYARAGRRSHALRQYLQCRRTLVDTAGIEPEESTTRLQAGILAGEAV